MTLSLWWCALAVLQDAPGAEFGAEAPAHCWYTQGGSAARTGVTLTPPLRGTPAPAWEYQSRGTLVGEPLVWQEAVILEEDEGRGRRSLLVVDLLSGELIARERFQTPVPLQPTVWNRVVVVRSAPRQLTAIRIYPGTVKSFHRWDCETEVYDPLLVEGFVFARLAGGLVALRLWHQESLWELDGAYRGRLSLRGDLLYVMEYPPSAMGRLVTVDWRRGRVTQALGVAHHGGRRPSRTAGVMASVLDRWVFVDHVLPVPTQGGGQANVTFTERIPGGSALHLKTGGVVIAPGWFAAHDGGWLGQLELSSDSRLLLKGQDLEEFSPLASPDHHPEFLAAPSIPTLARGVAYVGTCAVDLSTSRILWQLDVRPGTRLVPARETLLYVEDGRRLVALREGRERQQEPRFLELPPPELDPWRGRAVLRDGGVVHGAFTAIRREGEPEKQAVLAGRRHGRRARWTLGDLLWLEDETGRLQFASSGNGVLEGLDVLVERELAREYTELAKAAGSAGDPDLLAHLLAEATRRGSEDWQTIAGAEERLRRFEELIHQGRPPRISERRVRSIAQRERELRGLPASLLWQRVKAVPEATPWDLRLDLLRAVLQADPAHREARDLVRSLLPRGVLVGEDFDALDWLDFVESLRHTTIRFVGEPAAGAEPTHAQRELMAAKSEWRQDLVGVASPSLLVITPLRNPGRIARCLAFGELVCDTLEELFAAGRHQRDERLPLKLFLYETEQEYREQSKIPVEQLEWTAGHYSLTENVARIFLPHDADAFAEVMNTYAHELTHHWVVERCPRFRGRDLLRMRPDQPGFWIVEGFASLIESFEFDLRGWEARPRALPESLDLITNAPRARRISWPAVFDLTHVGFGSLDRRVGLQVSMSEYLGIGRSLSQTGLFYVQAEAACQYLFHAEGGRHREALLEFVGNYYSGQREALDVSEAFGMTPRQLGQAIEVFAGRRQDQAVGGR